MMPRAPIEPEGTFAGLRANAIVFGVFVDIAVTVLASTLLVLGLAPDALSGDEAVRNGALDQLYGSIAYTVGSLAIGSLGTVFGAFAGARRAGQLHVRHGGWIAVTSTAIGVLLTALQPVTSPDPADAIPLWVEVAAWLLILPSGVVGGALAGALQR
jgi:hypothetical protein